MNEDRFTDRSRIYPRQDSEDESTPERGAAPIDLWTDPKPDPVIASILGELESESMPAPDWDSLRRRVVGMAARQLERRRTGGTWWHLAAEWAGRAIPAGLAAGILLMIGLRATSPVQAPPAPEAAATRVTLESVLVALIDEVMEATLPASGDDLLRAAIPIEE